MGPLIFIARTHQIKRKKSQLNLRLMQIQNQREDLAAQISNAQQQKSLKSSYNNAMNQLSTSNFYRNLMNQMQGQSNSSDTLKSILGNDLGSCVSSGNYALQFGQLTSALGAQSSINNFLNSLGDESDQADLAQLNMIDSQLEQEQTGIETQLKMLEAEEQSVQKQMDQEIKNSAPKFGLSG